MDFTFDTLWSGVKQVAEKAGEIAKDVVTVGGYSSLNKSIAAYEVKLREHGNSILKYKDANANFKTAVETLGVETSDCMTLLKDAKDLVERLSNSTCSSKIPALPKFTSPDLSHVTATLADFDAAITAGKGAGIGIAASTGAWVLVAHLGTASTGAAIAGLGGIAAQNAILAWFGGGAIAAGGGGMLLGGVVIGAIVLLPLVGYSAFKSYKEASRIDAEAIKVEESAKSNLQNAAKLDELKTSANSLRQEMAEKRESFTNEFAALRLQALKLAEVTAASANSFADKLVLSAKAKGATA